MTTDEMILDLVAAGFVLPEGLFYETHDGFSWFLQNHNGRAFWHLEGGQHKHAHDLCAMGFARQWSERHGLSSERPPMHASLGYGDTEGAIKALWERVCDGV